MAATIAPGRLLGTLKILLSPNGGIKSHQEVGRLVSLMQKFSRKLVSKVIYIHILKSSTLKLLEAFLVESGWELLSSWLSRAVISTNWPLCTELLDLLTLCPPPPLPTRQAVQDLLHSIQVQNLQPGQLSTLAMQITSKWSQPGRISKSRLQATPSNLSSLSKAVVDSSAGSSLQDSPMTLSRRCKRSVIVTNPHVVANSSPPENGLMVVTFQENPLQNIVDVFKLQRRRGREEIETQVWKRQDVLKRKNESQKADERENNPRVSMLAPRQEECQYEDPSASVFEKSSPQKRDDVESPTGPRRSWKIPLGTSVSVVNDQAVTQIENLHEPLEEDVELEEAESPLKIFEEISNELKENLKFEKHNAISQVAKRSRICGNVWGMNNNEKVSGFEGSAKDYRLARRERFREEQKLLEEQHEAQERKEREVKRERIKKAKKEEDGRAKMVKELDEKKRKMEKEVEEKKKREKMEAEFKKRREEERSRRKEKERRERNLGSMKSELKDGLNSVEKSRIKLIAEQMKQNSGTSDSSSKSSVLGRIPKLGKITTSDETEASQASKPAKPLFSVAKNKNKDLLASLEAPLKPSKRPMDVARDPVLKKSVPPFLNRKLPAEPRLNCVDYGTSSLALDSASQCLKNMEDDGKDGKDCKDKVPSKLVVKAVSNEVEADAPNSAPRQDDLNPEESALEQVVESASATIELQETLSKDRNGVKSKTIETSRIDDKIEMKIKYYEKNIESKISQDDKKAEAKKRNDVKKTEARKSHDEMKSEAKKSHDDKKAEVKKSHEIKSESKKSHDKKNDPIKPPLTLKPVSQLKESSLFGSLLENVEKSSQKKRRSSSQGSDHNRNSKHFKTENVKTKDVPAISKTPPPPVPVANVPRKVSGILIVERGSIVANRSVKWRDDEELVQVEYFEVDEAERVNVHKLKFEEIRQQELLKERSLLSTRHKSSEKEAAENPWKGLKILDDCGRGSFKAGNKSGERELQRMREERVLPIVCFGNIPLNPSEPDVSMNRNILGVGTTRDILADDISGEGTEVDYSADGWPEPSGILAGYEDGIGAGHFYGGSAALRGQVDASKGHGRHAGELEGMGQRVSSSHPHFRGFGRGASAASWATRGFRGGFDSRGRGGFGGKRNVPCKYWRRGTCRDGQDCKFMHI